MVPSTFVGTVASAVTSEVRLDDVSDRNSVTSDFERWVTAVFVWSLSFFVCSWRLLLLVVLDFFSVVF